LITDQDVAELYRCLLGRAPETPDTVAAFKAYYPDFARGRRAILQSAEFVRLAGDEHGDTASRLAHAFLRRAGGEDPAEAADPRPDLCGVMRVVLRAHGAVRLAVIVGGSNVAIGDLAPLESAHAAVLHIATDAPRDIPAVAELPAGGWSYRVAMSASEASRLLSDSGLRIDLLAVLGEDAGWFTALRENLAPRAVLAGDQPLPPETFGWPEAERELHTAGIYLRFLGGWFVPVTYTPAAPAEPVGEIQGLCIAAIMRNEAVAAPNMLASVAPIASSFVIIDTGSDDDTVECVTACLRGIGKPFSVTTHAADRFDDMRNAALDRVPDSAAWVLMLDADEELCAEDHASLRDLMQHADRDAYALPRYNYTGADKSGEVAPYPDRQVRLLRHTPARRVRYSGAVHEKILGVDIGRVALDAGVLGLDRGGPHIHHLVRRFRSPEAEAAKQAFYRAIAARHGETV